LQFTFVLRHPQRIELANEIHARDAQGRESTLRYDTAILATRFMTEASTSSVIDFMPVSDPEVARDQHTIVRVVRGVRGRTRFGLGLSFSYERYQRDPASVDAETRAIFERAGRMLAAFGLGFDRVVKTVECITPAARASYRETARVRRKYLGPVYPAATGILMPRLLHPEALIQCNFIATRDSPVAVNPGWARYQQLTYSPGVRAGRLLFMSGQGSLDSATGAVVAEGDHVVVEGLQHAGLLAVAACSIDVVKKEG
jgi:enamine deaminase RidA (YjgF/YER057c/UK114 family)